MTDTSSIFRTLMKANHLFNQPVLIKLPGVMSSLIKSMGQCFPGIEPVCVTLVVIDWARNLNLCHRDKPSQVKAVFYGS